MNQRTLSDKELLSELARHGFKQQRHTTHGIMWLCRGYKFFTPLIRGGASFNDQGRHAESRTRDWCRLRDLMYREMPGFRERMMRKTAHVDIHAEVERMTPLDEIQRTALAESVALHTGPMPDIAVRIEDALRPTVLPATPATRATTALTASPVEPAPPQAEEPPQAAPEEGSPPVPSPATSWTCPDCKVTLMATGRHREACPARLRTEAPLPAPALLQGKVQPKIETTERPTWEVTPRPTHVSPAKGPYILSPLTVGLLGTLKSGKALCFRNLTKKQMDNYKMRAQSAANRQKVSFRSQQDGQGTLWLWAVKLVPRTRKKGRA